MKKLGNLPIFWGNFSKFGEKTQITQKNGYLGIRFIERAEIFWNGGLL